MNDESIEDRDFSSHIERGNIITFDWLSYRIASPNDLMIV